MFVVSASSDVAMCFARAKQSLQMSSNVLRSCIPLNNESEVDRPCTCAYCWTFSFRSGIWSAFSATATIGFLAVFDSIKSLNILFAHGGTCYKIFSRYDRIKYCKKNYSHLLDVPLHGRLPVALNGNSGWAREEKRKKKNMENWCGQATHSWIFNRIWLQNAIYREFSQRLPINWISPRALMSSVYCVPDATKKIYKRNRTLIHVLLKIYLHCVTCNIKLPPEFWFYWTAFCILNFVSMNAIFARHFNEFQRHIATCK